MNVEARYDDESGNTMRAFRNVWAHRPERFQGGGQEKDVSWANADVAIVCAVLIPYTFIGGCKGCKHDVVARMDMVSGELIHCDGVRTGLILSWK